MILKMNRSRVFRFDFQEVASQVIETVLDQEQCPYEAQVSLGTTDDETIHRTNLEFRKIDRATHVSSFSYGRLSRSGRLFCFGGR